MQAGSAKFGSPPTPGFGTMLGNVLLAFGK
jgi:hypothetical protein